MVAAPQVPGRREVLPGQDQVRRSGAAYARIFAGSRGGLTESVTWIPGMKALRRRATDIRGLRGRKARQKVLPRIKPSGARDWGRVPIARQDEKQATQGIRGLCPTLSHNLPRNSGLPR